MFIFCSVYNSHLHHKLWHRNVKTYQYTVSSCVVCCFFYIIFWRNIWSHLFYLTKQGIMIFQVKLSILINQEKNITKWTATSKFGTYRLCEQRRFRRACASAQSRQNLRCSLIQAVSREEPSDRKPDPWPLWMAGHAQLKFVMTECSKTQNRLTGLKFYLKKHII